eukprot:CAMPEP_0176329454 /NCGR_PEP_ID=MMETSP0121_2-20121125/75493_1 /TAXON_ID=160619 /ORGANISM="Kryptoperidinium foliaceum, Strain CCMP 1326" /LENGTH=33 /DNA_ID= /DNA_START= /DNA_END= /DNA_ORIENTATION=
MAASPSPCALRQRGGTPDNNPREHDCGSRLQRG